MLGASRDIYDLLLFQVLDENRLELVVVHRAQSQLRGLVTTPSVQLAYTLSETHKYS